VNESLVVGDLATIETYCNKASRAWIAVVSSNDRIVDHGDKKGFSVVSEYTKESTDRERRVGQRDIKAWKYLFDGIVRKQFQYIKYDQIHFDAEYADDEFPRPYWLSKLKPDAAKMVKSRYATLTQIGHFMRTRNTIWIMRMCAGWESSATDPFFGRLAYYYDSLGVGEPFLETQGGNAVKLTCDDAVAPTRMLTLLNGWILAKSFGHTELILEIVDWIFNDPLIRTKELKNWLAVIRQSAFCITTRGKSIMWDEPGERAYPLLIGYTVMDIQDNDRVYYTLMKDEISTVISEIRKAGMTLLGELCVDILSKEFNDESANELVLLGAVIGLTGFSRTKEEVVFPKTLNHTVEDPNISVPPYSQYLEDNWRRSISYLVKDNKLLDYDSWKRMVSTILTTRSSGGYRFDMDLLIPGRREPLKARFSSKVGVFLSNPYEMTSLKAIVKKYTMEEPGVLGRRHVIGGRSTRAIAARRLPHYLAEGVIAIGLNDYVSKKTEKSPPIGSSNDFQFGAERNSVLADHGFGAYASSRKDIIQDISDYSAFDFTQRELNSRKIAREAIVKELKLRSITGAWGEFKDGLVGLIETIWGEGITKDSVFRLPAIGDKDEQYITMDQLQSGEFLTAVYNSFTNRANVELQEEKRNLLFGSKFELLNIKILGDDLVRFIRIVDEWTTDIARQIAELHMNVSASNGFKQQRTKTVMRLFFYEFLKKSFVYGVNIPLMQMQAIAAEKPDETVDAVERMRGYYSKLENQSMRGLNSNFALNLLVWTYAVKRSARVQGSVRETYYPPMATLFTPASWGGVGLLPYTIHAGASLDGVIATYASQNADYRERIEIAGGIADFRRSDIAKRMAKRIVAGEGTSPRDAFKPGVQYIKDSLLSARAREASVASKDLMKLNIRPPSKYAYWNLPERIVEQALAGDRNLRTLIAYESGLNGKLMIDNLRAVKRKNLDADYDWIVSMSWNSEPLAPSKAYEIGCVAGVDEITNRLLIEFGVGADPDVMGISPNDIMQILRKGDRYARRDVTAEELFHLILSDAYIENTDALSSLLIYMGFLPSNIANLMSRLNNASTLIQLRKAAKVASTAGGFTSWINQGISNYDRLISAPYFVRPEIGAVINEIAFSRCVSESFRLGGLQKISIIPNAKSGELSSKAIVGASRKEWVIWSIQTGYSNP
jgi:hypothetical protein